MRTMLALLLYWALSQPYAAAQTRAAGPWRVVKQPVRHKRYPDWAVSPSPTTQGDTTTAECVQRKLARVPWNVHPDSVTLFLGCQNPLLAPVAPRGRVAPLRFVATGATVRLDSKQRLLLVVPSAPVVVLRAYQGSRLIMRHAFRAVPPPLPTVKGYYAGCEATICIGPYEKSTYLRTLSLRVLPDLDFAKILPEDARYRVAQFRASLLRQGKVVELMPGQPTERLVQGPQGDMSDLTRNSQLGDQLQIDILLVQRQNSLGIITEVPVVRQFIVNNLKCPAQE